MNETKTKTRQRRERLRITGDMDDAQLLTIPEACVFLNVCRASFDELRDQGRNFPKPFRVTVGTTQHETGLRFSVGQLRRWVKKQEAKAEEAA